MDAGSQREPNAEHRVLFQGVASLIRSDGLAESFTLAKSGRKHPELIARLSELSNLLTAHGGARCSYEKGFSGVDPGCLHGDSAGPFSDLNVTDLLA